MTTHLAGATVGVTGATGFLGRYLVDSLLARGAKVVGVVRNPDRVPALAKREGVTMRKADLADTRALIEGFAGCDAVIANAALFDVNNRDWDAHIRANVNGTENVLTACAKANVKRVVHVSSVAVYAGGKGKSAAVDEEFPQWTSETKRGRMNAYPVSKALSEQRAWELAKQEKLALTAVRPCIIYGAFDPNFMRIVKRFLSSPVSVLPLGLHVPLVYAGDVADACAVALGRDATAGSAYNTAGDDRPVRSFLEAWVAAGGPTPRVMLPVPAPGGVRYDNSRAERALDFSNRSYVKGLADTFERESVG